MITLIAEAALRSLALALFVALCLAVLRVRSPHIKKSIWAAVLFASLAMPLFILVPIHPLLREAAPVFLVVVRPFANPGAHVDSGWIGTATVLYGLVAAALLSRYIFGLVRVLHIRRNARAVEEVWTAGLDVRATPSLAAPATCGSTVLLPSSYAGWPHNKVAAVFAHERSHVVEMDSYLLWLSRLNACLFWFSPMAWWLHQKIASLAETTSDDAALTTLADRPAYAEILLEFARQPAVTSVATPMARSTMTKRIERIIGGAASPSAPTLSRRWLAVAASLPAIVVSAMALHAAPLSDPKASNTQARPDAAPHVTNWGGFDNLMKYYPPEAKRLGIDGTVDVAVTLDPQGRATDTLILSENPPDMGFGAAASAVAHSMQYSNPTGHQVQFTFRVKFDLRQDTAPTTTDGADSADKKIAVDAQDTDTREVVAMIARKGNHNILMGDQVSGKITLHLKDVTWREALNIVLLSKGLIEQQSGNITLIDIPH
jgi:TonB family protein